MKAGTKVKQFRELNQLKQADFADLVTQETGVKVSVTTVGRWERDQRHVPEKVLAFMEGRDTDASPPPPTAPLPGEAADDMPPRDPAAAQSDDAGPHQPASSIKPLGLTSQAYEKACIDLWQMIGWGVQLAGQGVGNPVVASDGAIIQQQADDLGKAYGKLAEQNDTFRRLIMGLTQGGIWVEVTGVTVKLAMTIAQNHAAYAQAVAQAAADAAYGNGAQQPQQPQPEQPAV